MIEQIREGAVQPARAVVFDFDGTIGMVRAGWMPLMLDMMMSTLSKLSAHRDALFAEAEDYVARLTGRDTVEQMNAFADHVRRLGGTPKSGAEYKSEFLALMEHRRAERLDAVRRGRTSADALLIPGARALLGELRVRGLMVYLASGSDHADIVSECELLGISGLFDGIYGSAPNVPDKGALLRQIVDSGIPAASILTFGDGRTEIELTRLIGGRTVGVASDEPECLAPDPKKRRWLIDAGADWIIPNYLVPDLLTVVMGDGFSRSSDTLK